MFLRIAGDVFNVKNHDLIIYYARNKAFACFNIIQGMKVYECNNYFILCMTWFEQKREKLWNVD